MSLKLTPMIIGAISLFLAANSLAQQTAVMESTSGDKVYLRVDGLSLRSNLDTLFGNVASLGDQIDNLSWADVLENGTTPGTDVDFFGYNATGLGQVTTTGTFTGDSLVLNKDAAITGRLNVSNVTTLGDSLLVAGTVVLNDSLRVVSAVSMGSRLHVTGVTALGDSLHVVGNVDLDALFNVDGAATFGSTVTIAGETTLNDTLHVDAAALFSDSIHVGGNARFSGSTQADGATSVGSTLSVAGATTLSSTLGVAGKTTLADSLIANGGADFNSTLNVDGNTTLNGTTIDGNLDLNGNADVSGTFDVTGAAALAATLDVSGVTTLSDTLHAEAPAMLDDSLRVGGNTRLTQDLWVDGNTNIGGTVNITGATTLGGALSVSGVTSLGDSLHVSGGADFDGNLNVDGGTTTNTLSVTNTATFSGPSTFNDAATFGDSLYVNAPATFSDTAVFTGGAHITGGLNLDALTLNGVEIPALDDTDALPEGDSNLYFTAAREAALQAQLDAADSLNQVLTETFFNLLNQIADSATATTSAASAIGGDVARLNATIDNGGLEPENWGFIFSSDVNFADSTIFDGTISGNDLYRNLTGLTSATTYYYKAFIETILNRSVGNVISFFTVGDAVMASESSSVTGQTTSNLSATITDTGGGTISATGFKWSLNSDLSSSTSVAGNSLSGSFSSSLTGLASKTTYYYAPYATNEAGTFYGDTLSFTTWGPCNGSTTITYWSITYDIAEIGNNCWFAENLQTTQYNDGANIMSGMGGYYYPNNDASKRAVYGLLYSTEFTNQMPATITCPSGWSIPSVAQWETLKNAYSADQLRLTSADYGSWTGSNTSGFAALPAGYGAEWGSGSSYVPNNFGAGAYFISSSSSVGYYLTAGSTSLTQITYESAFSDMTPPFDVASIRCIKN